MIMGRPQRSLPPGKPEQLTQHELAKKLPPPVVHGPHTGTALRPALLSAGSAVIGNEGHHG